MDSYLGQWVFWYGIWYGVIAQSIGNRVSCRGFDFIGNLAIDDAAVCLGKNSADTTPWGMDWGDLGGRLFSPVDLISHG